LQAREEELMIFQGKLANLTPETQC
jgi:hypothetical protein